jgi:hypothetical protein
MVRRGVWSSQFRLVKGILFGVVGYFEKLGSDTGGTGPKPSASFALSFCAREFSSPRQWTGNLADLMRGPHVR